MKHFYLSLSLILISISAIAQIPGNYYDSAAGLNGYSLKTELHNIISTGYQQNSYDNLYTGYQTTDVDLYYENDGTVLDMYSEKPAGTDAYNYNHTSGDQCGNYNSEGDCYNREHLIPQSVYNQALPMRTDIHQVIPTDGKVNGQRSNYPFGIVSSPSWISTNGSKVGNYTTVGYNGQAFEPIDEFKGDIARAVLYFAVRYEGQVGNWNFPMFDGSNDKVFTDWALDLLLQWHANDPVSQREIDRNNAAYNYQNNANPFVSHPEYAQLIWNPNPDVTPPTPPTMLVASNSTDNSVNLYWNASSDNVAVTSYNVYIGGTLAFNTSNTTTSTVVNGLQPDTMYCFTVTALDANANESAISNEVCETTTNSGTGTQDCVTETFENISTSSSSYTDVNWTGDNGLTWTATEARTDQTINGKAIVIDGRGSTMGTLTSPTISGGIGNLTLTTKRVFSGNTGDLSVYVNGVLKGTVPYDNTVQTTTLSGLNTEGNVVVTISEDTAQGDRVAIDDLSWTCYSVLGTETFNETSDISIYPNPITGSTLTIKTNRPLPYTIYDVLGQRVKSGTTDEKTINVSNLNNGLYLIKIKTPSGNITKKLVKQ